MSGRNETDNRNAAKSFLNNLNIPKLSEEELVRQVQSVMQDFYYILSRLLPVFNFINTLN